MKKIVNYAFIDSQNLNLSIKDRGWKLDFQKFRVLLRDKFNVGKAFLFVGYVEEYEEMYTALKNAGFVLIYKPTLEKKGVVKGNCDAEMVLRCMIEYKNFDKAVIVSGDGDFHCLVEYLASENKLLKIGIPDKRKYSSLLRKYSKFFFYISDFKDKLKYRKSSETRKDQVKFKKQKNPSSLSKIERGLGGESEKQKTFPPNVRGSTRRRRGSKKGEHSFRHQHLR